VCGAVCRVCCVALRTAVRYVIPDLSLTVCALRLETRTWSRSRCFIPVWPSPSGS
jgi:hypothetical protein